MSIELKHVFHIYGKGTPFEKQALQDVSITINDGEFLGIIGHTGSGKSTFIQHLNGLLRPSQGQVLIDGYDIGQKGAKSKALRQKVGMVFQYPEHQLFEETIAKDIAFGPRNLGLSDDEIDKRVRDAMEFVGLDYKEYAERSPFQLSGGQMRRVAIAGVIALKPDYLILDEPSAGLDPAGRDAIFREIQQLHKEQGMTVILVSHNMDDISHLATRLLVFDKGSIILDGAPMDIFTEHRQELEQVGVDIPPLSITMEYLRSRGLAVDNRIVTIDQAVKAIEKEVGDVK